MLALCLILVSFAVPPPAEQDLPVTALTVEAVSAPEPTGLISEEALAGRVRTGKSFTPKQKQIVKQKNAEENDGKNRCENCDTETVPAKKHEKGVTPPRNETQVDHKIPKAQGGPGEVDNAQVLCRDCNLKKGSKDPVQEEAP